MKKWLPFTSQFYKGDLQMDTIYIPSTIQFTVGACIPTVFVPTWREMMDFCDSVLLSYPHICYRYYISLGASLVRKMKESCMVYDKGSGISGT